MNITLLLFYVIFVIFRCVQLYFIVFYLLFNKSLMIINNCVIKYLDIFEKIFIYSIEIPNIIIYLVIIIFLCLLFSFLIIKEIFKVLIK